jgi:hypothetical protein
MKGRARTVVLVLSACLAAAVTAVFLWLPWNPFEDPAGPLDEWVPADVDALVRFDARALRDAEAVHKLWDGPAGLRLRDDFDLDAKLDDLRRIDAELAALPFAGDDPPTVGRDLLGGEVLVALRGDDVLAMSRITARAKAIDLVRRAGDERRAQWGVRVDGDAYVADAGDGRSVHFARRRDVLLVATSRELLASAVGLADGRGASIAASADYRAVRPAAPSGAKASAWAAGRTIARLAKTPSVLAKPLAPAFAHGAAVEFDASEATAIRARVSFDGDGADLCDVALASVHAQAVSSREETFAAGALPLSAHDAVALLFDSQPPARRELVETLLRDSGSSVRAVVNDVARHLEPGVGFVVSRLPETDRLRLDNPDGDPVEPIPATVAVFRLADQDAEALLADLRRHAAHLFGEDARLVESAASEGARWFVADVESFGREWALLRPALVVRGRTVVFSTNEAYLRRCKAVGVARFDASPRVVGQVSVFVPNLSKRLDDLRWEVADRATWRDWAVERSEVREDLARRFPSVPIPERERREDDEIARRIDERKRRLFPEAVREYREKLRFLDAFGEARFVAVTDGGLVRIDATIGLR